MRITRNIRAISTPIAKCWRQPAWISCSRLRSRRCIRAGFRTSVNVEGLGDRLEGQIRPGHFRGVATVVLKLLEIVAPQFAYFGRKDAQQARIVRQMAADLALDSEIVVCPIVREPDGLAMSSRNRYLSAAERKAAAVLYRALSRGAACD